jgi:hypothetical protein
LALLAAGAVWLCVWEAGISRDSEGAHRSVALLVLAGLLTAVVLGRGRQHLTSRQWIARNARGIRRWRTRSSPAIAAAVIWAVLIAAVVGWDIVSFIYQAHALPTLSFFIGHVTRYRIGRGLVFALWLGTGGYLAVGWRAKASQ